jgi:hypothetical protein
MVLLFFFSFFCSVIFAVFLTYILKRRGPGPFNGMLYFFAIILFFTMAMGTWLHPIGPMLGGIPWVTVIGGGFLIMLLIAELVPHHEKGRYVKTKKEIEAEETKDEEILQKEFSILAYIMMTLLAAAIIYAAIRPKLPFSTGF